MKAITKLRERRALSPVIATVILVAVAITVAVAVSYWMSSIAGQYTSFEKVEIQSAYANIEPGGGWTITLVLKNSGSATANLITAFVNDEPVDTYETNFADNELAVAAAGDVPAIGKGTRTGTNIPEDGLAVESGEIAVTGDGDDVEVYIGSDLFSSGTTINIKIHSAGGMDYIRLIKLT